MLLAFCMLALPHSSEAEKKWRTKTECTLIPNESNDGDSFHVRVGGRHYIFRLLFVDCPETDDRVPDRLKEQAAYWGVMEKDIPKLGKQAARFTEDFLKKPFTVYTQFDDAMGASKKDRDYALITGADGRDLGQALVAEGLARIHGVDEAPPDGPSVTAIRMRLKGAESEARKAGRGAWGVAQPVKPGAGLPVLPPMH